MYFVVVVGLIYTCYIYLLQILNESEGTIMRLTEQAKVLKEEIRRLERNQERDKSVSNMEYLKNIVFKVSLLSELEWVRL